MFTIISFFQKLIKGGRNKSGGLENFSKINKRGGGDDYSVLESMLFVRDTANSPFCKSQRK